MGIRDKDDAVAMFLALLVVGAIMAIGAVMALHFVTHYLAPSWWPAWTETEYGTLMPVSGMRIGDGVRIEVRRAVTGGAVSEVHVSYSFDWNDDDYALPDNFTAFVVVNDNQSFECPTEVDTARVLSTDYVYYIVCSLKVQGEVRSLRLVAVADGVVIVNGTIWRDYP